MCRTLCADLRTLSLVSRISIVPRTELGTLRDPGPSELVALREQKTDFGPGHNINDDALLFPSLITFQVRRIFSLGTQG